MVHYVDYGNDDLVNLSDLKHLSSDHMTTPIQCIPCTLLGVRPDQGQEWSEDSVVKFEDITQAEVFQMLFYILFVLVLFLVRF